MKTSSFSYELPEDLIAKHPPEERADSRLLVVENGYEDESTICRHFRFSDIAEFLYPGDLLVFNNTRVIPARLFGRKESGGQVEILVERILDANSVLAHVRASKSPKPGSKIILDDENHAVDVVDRRDDLFALRSDAEWLPLLDKIGHVPLPPYIDREDQLEDRERYQTVYAKAPGAVAAPTAGLHFDKRILEQLTAQGVDMAEVTLHVGAGTFQPVRVDDVSEHRMHSEWMSIDQNVINKIRNTKARGNRVIAVGTTAVRTLETAARESGLEGMQAMQGETDIFIYPGFEFQVVDGLLTNFHLPESTLMMLVSAFAGYSNIMAAYEEAVYEEYRFFSYGDAMLLTRNPQAVQDIPE